MLLLLFGTICIAILSWALKYFIKEHLDFKTTTLLIEKEGKFTCAKRGTTSAHLRRICDSKPDERVFTLKDHKKFYLFNKYLTVSAQLFNILLFSTMLLGMIYWLYVMSKKTL
jgi:hypothetical protein